MKLPITIGLAVDGALAGRRPRAGGRLPGAHGPGPGAERAEGPHRTLKVGKKHALLPDRSRRPSTRPRSGDTIKLADGTYHESVKIHRRARSATCA